MKKLNLQGLDYVIKNLNQTIKISPDDFTKQYVDKNSDIRIEILEDGKVVNGITTRNLISGLIVCSNHYLPESFDMEDMRNIKTKLEKAIRKGAIVKIKKINDQNSLIKFSISIKGDEKYNYYADNLVALLRMVEETKKVIQNSL